METITAIYEYGDDGNYDSLIFDEALIEARAAYEKKVSKDGAPIHSQIIQVPRLFVIEYSNTLQKMRETHEKLQFYAGTQLPDTFCPDYIAEIKERYNLETIKLEG